MEQFRKNRNHFIMPAVVKKHPLQNISVFLRSDSNRADRPGFSSTPLPLPILLTYY